MEILREQNVASFALIPLVDAADRPNYKASPTIAAGDVKIIRHTGAAWNESNIGTLPAVVGGTNKQVLITFTATELNPDDTKYPIIVQFVDQTGTKEWDDQTVIVWTRAAVSNVKELVGDAQSATDIKDFADAGYDPATNKVEGVKIADSTTALGAQAKLDVNAEADTALSDIGLDHMVQVAVTGTDITDNSIIAQMVSKAATSDWDTFDNTKDSLEASRVNQVDIKTLIEHQRGAHTVQGDIFYVDPVNGATYASGARGGPDDPLAGIQDCHDNLVTDSMHDLIILVSGAAAGVTTLTEDVTLTKRYLQIRGPGRDFIWVRTGVGTTIAITGDGIGLEGFQVKTDTTGTGDAIDINGADFVLVRNLWFNYARANGINMHNSSNAVIDCNNFQDIGVAGTASCVRIDASSGDSNNNKITDNVMEDTTLDGIHLTGAGGGNNIYNTMINGNTIHGSGQYGINVESSDVEDTVIQNNALGDNASGDINDAGTNTIIIAVPLSSQEVRDSMKLAPTVGAPTAGSVDSHLDDIQAVTDLLPNAGALTDIDTGVNAIEAKLPTNFIMGSSDQTDKDDEIDAIKAVTDLLPNAGALTDIDTGVNAIEAKLPTNFIMGSAVQADKDDEIDSIKTTVEGLNDLSYANVTTACDTAISANTDINNIDSGVDIIEAKLPTNFIMGSAVQTAKDDEIDSIKSTVEGLNDISSANVITACDTAITANATIVAIDTGVDIIEAKLPTNYIMGSSVQTDKDDEIDAIDTATANMNSKMPVGTVASETDVQSIQNNTRFVSSLPTTGIIPPAGDYVYKIVGYFYNTIGQMEDPDGATVDSGTTTSTSASKLVETGQNFLTTVKVGDRIDNTTDATSTMVTAVDSDIQLSLSNDIMTSGETYDIVRPEIAIQIRAVQGQAYKTALYDDENTTVAATISPVYTPSYYMTKRLGVGQFVSFYKLPSTEAPDQWTADFALTENSQALHYTRAMTLYDETPGTSVLADSTVNKDIIAKAMKERDVSGTGAVAGSVYDDVMDNVDASEVKIDAIKAVTDLLPNAGALTDIDTGVNAIEAKLPTNYIMGSSVQTDKDDEIDSIKSTVEGLNDLSAAQVNAEVDTALSDIGLDHMVSVAVSGSDIADDSIIAQMVSKSGTADWDSFDNTTDALEALRDNQAAGGLTSQQVRDSMKLAPTGGAPATGSVDEHLDTIDTVVDAVKVVTDVLPNAGALTDIDTGVNNIEAKLPTNFVMGSSDQTDKDDEIDAIKAKTDLLAFTTGNVHADIQEYNTHPDIDLAADQSGVTIGTVNDLGTGAKAAVNQEVDTSLADYDGPTKTELDTVETNLTTEINANETKIDGIQTDLDNATDGLGAIKGAVDDNQTNLTSIEGKVDTIGTDVDAVQAKTDNLNFNSDGTTLVLVDVRDINDVSVTDIDDFKAGASDVAGADVNVTTIEGADATVQLTAACDASIETYGLDHLVAVAVLGTEIADNSIIAQLASKSATADWDSFSNVTDSLEALGDGTSLTAQQTRDAMKLAPSGGAPASESLDDRFDTMDVSIAAVDDVILAATIDGTATMAIALKQILAYCAGNINRVGSAYTYRNYDDTANEMTHTGGPTTRVRS